MFDHFTNSAVYAFIIEDIIVTTVNKFPLNQKVILFLNRGATAIMQMEVWKRFLMARNNLFTTKKEMLNVVDDNFMRAVQTVRNLFSEGNPSLIFF